MWLTLNHYLRNYSIGILSFTTTRTVIILALFYTLASIEITSLTYICIYNIDSCRDIRP